MMHVETQKLPKVNEPNKVWLVEGRDERSRGMKERREKPRNSERHQQNPDHNTTSQTNTALHPEEGCYDTSYGGRLTNNPFPMFAGRALLLPTTCSLSPKFSSTMPGHLLRLCPVERVCLQAAVHIKRSFICLLQWL